MGVLRARPARPRVRQVERPDVAGADRERGRDGDRPADLRRGGRGGRRTSTARSCARPRRAGAIDRGRGRRLIDRRRSESRDPRSSAVRRRSRPPSRRRSGPTTRAGRRSTARPSRIAMPMIGAPIRLSSADAAIEPEQEDDQPAVHRPEDDLVGPRPAARDGRRPRPSASPKIRLVMTPMNAVWSLATSTPGRDLRRVAGRDEQEHDVQEDRGRDDDEDGRGREMSLGRRRAPVDRGWRTGRRAR